MEFVHFCRQQRTDGPGIFLKSGIEYHIINQQDKSFSFIAVKLKKLNIIFSGIYGPPEQNTREFLDFIDKDLQTVNDNKNEYFCFGDMNMNILDHSANANLIKNIYKSNGFLLCSENISTRLTKHSSFLFHHDQ